MKRFFLVCGSILAIAVAGYLGFHASVAYGTACGISNIQKSFSPSACTVTITWNTSTSTGENYVHWGANSGCTNPSYPNTANATSGTSHTAVIDCTDVGPKIAFQVESIGASCSETSGCNTATSGPCF